MFRAWPRPSSSWRSTSSLSHRLRGARGHPPALADPRKGHLSALGALVSVLLWGAALRARALSPAATEPASGLGPSGDDRWRLPRSACRAGRVDVHLTGFRRPHA